MPEVGLEPTLPGGNRILSPLRPQTRADTEGQEETKLCFYRGTAVKIVHLGHAPALRLRHPTPYLMSVSPSPNYYRRYYRYGYRVLRRGAGRGLVVEKKHTSQSVIR